MMQYEHPQQPQIVQSPVGLSGDASMGGAAVPIVAGLLYTGIGAGIGGVIGYAYNKKRTTSGAVIGALIGLGWFGLDMGRKK